MTHFEKLAAATSEENVKAVYIKALGLKAVLDAGRAIWRTHFERFGSFDYAIRERLRLNRADVGWYQVRNALKLYAESAEGRPTDFSAFESAYKALGDKLRPKVYEYGFLRQ